MIERAPEEATTPKPIAMAGVQTIKQMKLDHQMEETRRLLQQNKDEPTVRVA